MIGFTSYDIIPIKQELTTAEIVALLSGEQKGQILNGFAKKVKPDILSRIINVDKKVVIHLYKKIDEIEERARALMRGEVLITSAVIDPETGEITTPAVYNTAPTTANALLTQVQDDFADDFTGTQVLAILTKMVEYSKHNGTGDWAFYKNNVIL